MERFEVKWKSLSTCCVNDDQKNKDDKKQTAHHCFTYLFFHFGLPGHVSFVTLSFSR